MSTDDEFFERDRMQDRAGLAPFDDGIYRPLTQAQLEDLRLDRLMGREEETEDKP